ncbi:MAG: Ig-like domain-containing protein [Flavobacteriales bacterium]|nr:Ig-like domain-containing protein [Flavobacteriales bacterium]
MRALVWITLLGAILMYSSCKEDTDEIAPSVSITEPQDGQTVTMPDTIIVSARVEDDKQIEFINFGLVDINLNSIGQRISVGNISNPKEFSSTLEIIDLDIEDGTHYLEVFASDGTNDEREFIEMNIIAIPREYQGIVFLESISNDQTIKFIDTGGQVIDLTSSIEGDAIFSISSRLNSLRVFNSDANSLTSIQINSGLIQWEVLSVLQGLENAIDIQNDPFSRSTRILTDDSRIINYDKFGMIAGQVEFNSEWIPITMLVEESEIWLASFTPSGYRVSKLFKSTGFELDHFTLPDRPILLQRLNNDELIVIDEEGGVRILNSSVGGQFGISVVDSGDINSLLVNDGVAYFISSTSLYRYVTGAIQASIIHTGTEITGLTYDSVNQRLIIADSGSLEFYILNPLQNVGNVNIGGEIISPMTLFNK